MITDITKLFVDLSRIYLLNPVSIKQDYEKIPVYHANSNIWIGDGRDLMMRHDRPAYIWYTSSISEDGGAVQIGVKHGDEQNFRYYYMAPVDFINNELIFEINLNEILSRDLVRGELNDIQVVFKEYHNDYDGEINETPQSEVKIIKLYPDLFSRTTVLDDIFIFNRYFNKIKEFVQPSEEYNKPSIHISTFNNYGLRWISQYDDVILKSDPFYNYYCLSCYMSGPEDESPNQSYIRGGESNSDYENSFSHKFNLIYNSDRSFSTHLNEHIKDLTVSRKDTCEFVFKYQNDDGIQHQNQNLPIVIHYYTTDDNVSGELIKGAFKEIHRYI